MSDICLYYMPESGPCRTVMLAARILGVNLKLKYVDLFKGEHLTAKYLQLNPQHSVPTLTDGEFTLTESRVIMTYLADSYGKDDRLYPKDIQKRAVINQRLYFDIYGLYHPLVNVYLPIYIGKNFDETQLPYLKIGFENFEKFLSEGKFAVGNELTLADIALVSTVETAIAVLDYDLEPYPNVKKWYNYLKNTLPDYDDIMSENSQKLRVLVEDFRSGNQKY